MSGIALAPGTPRLAISALLRGGVDTSDVDSFLAHHSAPLVEGTAVTFLYRGEADSVRLQHWVYGLPSQEPFERIAGTDLWYHVLELPRGSRVEYKIELTYGDTRQLIQDPLNPLHARDPFGANSVCAVEGYARPDYTFEDPDARKGGFEQLVLRSRALGRDVPLQLYKPARFRTTRKYPLLVVHDGDDYLNYASLQAVLDNLIHRLEIPPLVAVLTSSRRRLVEYADHEPHARFLTEELVPRLQARLPLRTDAASRCLMGASFGAVAAFSTAARYPDTWGRLLLQSGSFAFSELGVNPRGPRFAPVVDFMNAYRDAPRAVADRVFVSCGVYESLIYENRSLIPLLQSTGMDVRFEEARDGHNWENWRDRLRTGLSWLFPGPLLMVYE